MPSNSTNGFFLSALLHGVVIGVFLLFTYALQQQVKESPTVFELVAGEGDNYLAREAPALGNSSTSGVKIDIPEAPVSKPAPVEAAPVQPAPKPIIERAPTPKAPAATKPPPDEIRDFKKDVARIAKKREQRLEKKYRAEQEAAERKAKAEEKRMTKEEFDRQKKGETVAAKTGNPRVPHIDAEGIARGVIGGSTANKIGGAGGKKLTREEADALDLYFSLLKQRLKDALDKPPGLSDTLVAFAEVLISADGTLSDARIKRSSGSDEFDHAVLEAIARVHSIGPRPDGRSEMLTIPFRMREEDDN